MGRIPDNAVGFLTAGELLEICANVPPDTPIGAVFFNTDEEQDPMIWQVSHVVPTLDNYVVLSVSEFNADYELNELEISNEEK